MRILSLVVLAALTSPVAADPAYVLARGVSRVDDAATKRVLEDKALIIDLAVDRDGDLWAASVSGRLSAIKGKTTAAVQLRKGDDKDVAAMTAAAQGGLWVLTRQSLIRVTDKRKLTRHPAPVPRVQGPAALHELGEELWAASDYGVFRFKQTWQKVRDGRCEGLVADSLGALWTVEHAGKSDRLIGWSNGKWLELAAPSAIYSIAAGKDGRLYALRADGLFVATRVADKVTWAAKPLAKNARSPLVVDGNERVWYMRGVDLVVIDKNGQQLASYAAGALPGVSGDIMKFVVARGGPPTLPKPVSVAKGTIKGRLMVDAKTPAANRTFELCIRNCTDDGPRVKLATDADGKFSVADVPAIEFKALGYMKANTLVVAGNAMIKAGGKAAVPTACCLQLKAGTTLDLGTIRLVGVAAP